MAFELAEFIKRVGQIEKDVRPDPEYLAHPRWPDVAATAAAAHQVLCRGDKNPTD